MKVQIKYKGDTVLSVELPVIDPSLLKFIIGGHEAEPEQVSSKKSVKDVPRIKLAEKDSVTFKRPKAEYSNKQFDGNYDF